MSLDEGNKWYFHGVFLPRERKSTMGNAQPHREIDDGIEPNKCTSCPEITGNITEGRTGITKVEKMQMNLPSATLNMCGKITPKDGYVR